MFPFPISWYLSAALALGVTGVAGYAFLEHAWRQTAELQAAQAEEANRRNQETIKTLRESKELSEQIMKELQDQLSAINEKEESDDAAVTELEQKDKSIREFLDTPIPPGLRCLWGEQAQCGTPHGNTDAH